MTDLEFEVQVEDEAEADEGGACSSSTSKVYEPSPGAPPSPRPELEEDVEETEAEPEEPPESFQQVVESVVARSAEVLDQFELPEKACHCKCSLGPNGTRCIDHFSESELEDIRQVFCLYCNRSFGFQLMLSKIQDQSC